MTNSNTLPPKIELLRRSVLGAYYALLFYFVVSTAFVFGEFRLASVVIWLVQVTPLLLFARGLHRGIIRTYGWVSFVILLYFMHGVLVAFEQGRLMLGIVEVLICILIFVLLIFYIREYREHFGVSI